MELISWWNHAQIFKMVFLKHDSDKIFWYGGYSSSKALEASRSLGRCLWNLNPSRGAAFDYIFLILLSNGRRSPSVIPHTREDSPLLLDQLLLYLHYASQYCFSYPTKRWKHTLCCTASTPLYFFLLGFHHSDLLPSVIFYHPRFRIPFIALVTYIFTLRDLLVPGSLSWLTENIRDCVFSKLSMNLQCGS